MLPVYARKHVILTAILAYHQAGGLCKLKFIKKLIIILFYIYKHSAEVFVVRVVVGSNLTMKQHKNKLNVKSRSYLTELELGRTFSGK